MQKVPIFKNQRGYSTLSSNVFSGCVIALKNITANYKSAPFAFDLNNDINIASKTRLIQDLKNQPFPMQRNKEINTGFVSSTHRFDLHPNNSIQPDELNLADVDR